MSQGKKRPKNKPPEETIIEVISNSIGQILRLSPNEDFRRKSFEVFSVSNTKEIEEHVSKGLTSILSKKNKLARKKKKKKKNEAEYLPELDSSDSLTLMNLAKAYDLTDMTILEKISQIENISEERNQLQIENEQNEAPGAISDNENIILLPENFLKETEVCVSDDGLTPTALSDEQCTNLQNSLLSQELFDNNWLEMSLQKIKGKPHNNRLNKESSLIQVNDSNDFCVCPQQFKDNYSKNVSCDSQSLFHQENLLLKDFSDPEENNLYASDYPEVLKSDRQNYLEANMRPKKLESSQSSF